MDNTKELHFKTNINCGGCVTAVTPHLNNTEGIVTWNVETTNTDKILTVKSIGITEQEIIEKVQKAGFKIEPISL